MLLRVAAQAIFIPVYPRCPARPCDACADGGSPWVGAGPRRNLTVPTTSPLAILDPMPRKTRRQKEAAQRRRLREREEALSSRCAYCHDASGPAPLERCERCQTLLHRDCVEFLGSCPTIGCGGFEHVLSPRPSDSPVSAGAFLVVLASVAFAAALGLTIAGVAGAVTGAALGLFLGFVLVPRPPVTSWTSGPADRGGG